MTKLKRYQSSLGILLYKQRIAIGQSIEDSSYLMDVSKCYYDDLEKGKRNISLNVLLKLSDGLHMKPSELMLRIEQTFQPVDSHEGGD